MLSSRDGSRNGTKTAQPVPIRIVAEPGSGPASELLVLGEYGISSEGEKPAWVRKNTKYE